jgi:hypothetical protein
VLAEHDKIVQEVNQRNQRLNASERRDDEYMEMISEYSMEPTKSFNQNGAHTLFQEVFKVLIGTACKLFKEQQKYMEMFRTLSLNALNQKNHKESQKLKTMVDEMLSHFANIIKDFRYYDKYLIIENDPWTVQKICKLSVLERTYFQIFHDQLTQILPVSKEFQSQVKLSLYHRMKQWFTDRYKVDEQGRIEVKSFLTLDHIILIFGLLQSPHQRLKLRNVFQVAVQNNMQPEARTVKYLNIADKYQGESHFQHQEVKNISNNKENLIHRIVLNEWRYVEYYVQETLDYCKKSRILTEAEIKELKVTRVERLQSAAPENGRAPYMKSNSYS